MSQDDVPLISLTATSGSYIILLSLAKNFLFKYKYNILETDLGRSVVKEVTSHSNYTCRTQHSHPHPIKDQSTYSLFYVIRTESSANLMSYKEYK